MARRRQLWQILDHFLNFDNRWISCDNGKPVTDKIPVGSGILIERMGGNALF